MNPFGAGPIPQKLIAPSLSFSIDSVNLVSRQNKAIVDLSAGMLVCADTASSGIIQALATSASRQKVIGLAKTAIEVDGFGLIQIADVLKLTTAEWDAVTGDSGGLTAGARYFLSAATTGKMSVTPPSTDGQYIVRVGWALSTTEFQIDIEPSVLL